MSATDAKPAIAFQLRPDLRTSTASWGVYVFRQAFAGLADF